jgi:hypothetical protein
MISLPILIAGFLYLCIMKKSNKLIFALSIVLLLILILYFTILSIYSLTKNELTFKIMYIDNYIKNYLQGIMIIGILSLTLINRNRFGIKK